MEQPEPQEQFLGRPLKFLGPWMLKGMAQAALARLLLPNFALEIFFQILK